MKYQTNRRHLIFTASTYFILSNFITKPTKAIAQMATAFNENGQPKHNIFSYRHQDWRDHFDNLKNGAILADISCRCVHFWTADGQKHLVFPSSVPLTENLTKRGITSVVQKITDPVWRPTKAMRLRDPKLPEFMPAGPENPLGTHALYLAWPSYRIHGTSDTRKIGRQSSSGCIGLYNEQIEKLFNLVIVGTQVRLI